MRFDNEYKFLCFYFALRSAFTIFDLPVEDRMRLNNGNKNVFCFALRSAFTIFDLWSKILALGNENKILCFYFALHSLNRIFAK